MARKVPRSRVLVVDDDCELADSLAELLMAHGYMADTVYDGESALLESKRHPYELAIIDIQLPDINGDEVANAILREGSARKILLMTGHTSTSVAESTEIVVLTKPIQLATLLAELE